MSQSLSPLCNMEMEQLLPPLTVLRIDSHKWRMVQSMKWEFKINSKRKEITSYEKIVEYILRERDYLS